MKKLTQYLILGTLSVSTIMANGMYPIDPNHPSIIHPDAKSFSIELPANPTTGYQWQVLSTSEGVDVSQKVYMAPDQPCCGAPGVEQLDVVLTDDFKGSGQIEMLYARPWEKDSDIQAKPIVIKIEK